jgi:tryptophan synthase alpha chain
VIVVDLPPEEDAELRVPLHSQGLHTIRLTTPTTHDARLKTVLEHAGGFVYYVSINGITGTGAANTASVNDAIKHLKQKTNLPLAVGFGIKDADSAAEFAKTADAVVVGSAIVQKIADMVAGGASSNAIVNDVSAFVQTLTSAVHHARSKEAA